MPDRIIKLSATFFYIGYLPLAPGSLASLAGVALAAILSPWLIGYVVVLALITWLGFRVSDRMEEIAKEKDPSCIVIDEVAGVMIAFFMLPLTTEVIWTAFFLFRAFDMFKIYPVNKLEELKGGTGVMMDDVIAGVYTNIIMQVAVRLAGIT